VKLNDSKSRDALRGGNLQNEIGANTADHGTFSALPQFVSFHGV